MFHCLCHFYFCIKCFKFSNTDMCLYSLSCEMENGSGFKVSLSMLKKMRIFYEEWQCLSIGSPMANQLQQLESIYYIHQVNLHHWNKYVLRKYLSDDLYHHQGNMPNNFPKTIPDIKQSMKTISMFKDEYLLDFINTEKNLKAYWVVNVTKYHQKLKKHENVRLDEKKEKPCYTQIRIQKSGYWISGSYITSGCNVG